MFYLIVALIIGLVISPVLYLKPSPRQKQQMQLRQKAMELGLQVKLSPLPGSDSVKKQRTNTNMMSYRLMRSSNDVKSLSHHYQAGRSLTDHSDWVFYQTKNKAPVMLGEAVLPLFSSLPESVVAIESMQGFVAVYWGETGGEEQLNMIVDTLKAIHGAEMNYFSQS